VRTSPAILAWAASALVLVGAACDKKDGAAHSAGPAPAVAPAAEPTPAPNLPPAPAGARRVPIQVRKTGYIPNSIEARAGEDLVLVFTRTEETECGRWITVKGTDLRAELPLNQPVDVPIKMPQTGEVVFACGMDMMHGIVSVATDEPAAEPGAPAVPAEVPALKES
jgi:Cu+-exporting ATPase